MANFSEVIGIARYQPAPKWMVQAKAIYYTQGRDSSNISYGSNIFLPHVAPYRTTGLWLQHRFRLENKCALCFAACFL
ncbi:MAG: hypothetical protein WDO16_06305 [Bacteroidota bacterium]